MTSNPGWLVTLGPGWLVTLGPGWLATTEWCESCVLQNEFTSVVFNRAVAQNNYSIKNVLLVTFAPEMYSINISPSTLIF